MNKLMTFNGNLVGVGQANYILTYDGTAWKEIEVANHDEESWFNSNCIESIYIPRLRRERCFMASSVGLYMSDNLT